MRAVAENCPLCGKSWKADLGSDYQAPDGYDKEVLRLLHLLDNIQAFSRGNYALRRAEGKVPWKILLELPGDPD